MKKLLCLLGILCLVVNGPADAQKINPLTIGDTMPNLTLDHLINYKTPTEKFSNLNKKLVILDFWATWCSSCINGFPKQYKLQQQYKDKIQILLVNSRNTKNTYQDVKHFFDMRKNAYRLPSVTLDTTLSDMFPHQGVPYYVWILNNKVVATTIGGETVTQGNINRLLAGERIASSVRAVNNLTLPLFVNANGGNLTKYTYRTLLTPYAPTLGGSLWVDRNDDHLYTRITLINSSLLTLYRYAYPAVLSNLSKARIIFNIPDKERFLNNTDTNNIYTYTSEFKPCSKDQVRKMMREDLQRYFGYKVDSKVMPMNCWILTSRDSSKAIEVSKKVKRETNVYENMDIPIFFINSSIFVLRSCLETALNAPVIDETNIKSNVTLTLPTSLKKIDSVKSSLEKQGLRLERELRSIPIAIISKPTN